MFRLFILVFGLIFIQVAEVKPTAGEDSRSEHWVAMRRQMIESQIRNRGVKDSRVLEALQKVPRHEFVSPEFEEQAYADGPLPIGHGQTISQPYIVAFMTDLLGVKPEEKVFEVGTGSGYQAAVLGELAKEVYTVEIVKPLYEEAQARLKRLGYRNIFVRFGDGTEGWPEAAPFDKMMVTAAGLKIPERLVAQLKEGGRLVMPVGDREQILIVGEKRNGILQETRTIPVRFVPLVEKKPSAGEKA